MAWDKGLEIVIVVVVVVDGVCCPEVNYLNQEASPKHHDLSLIVHPRLA